MGDGQSDQDDRPFNEWLADSANGCKHVTFTKSDVQQLIQAKKALNGAGGAVGQRPRGALASVDKTVLCGTYFTAKWVDHCCEVQTVGGTDVLFRVMKVSGEHVAKVVLAHEELAAALTAYHDLKHAGAEAMFAYVSLNHTACFLHSSPNQHAGGAQVPHSLFASPTLSYLCVAEQAPRHHDPWSPWTRVPVQGGLRLLARHHQGVREALHHVRRQARQRTCAAPSSHGHPHLPLQRAVPGV